MRDAMSRVYWLPGNGGVTYTIAEHSGYVHISLAMLMFPNEIRLSPTVCVDAV